MPAPLPNAAAAQQPGPLAGVRVIEFSHMVMGPSCGMVLADLGADVVKIEPAPAGDNTRRLTGPAIGFFPTFNRNKRSLCVDMKRPEGLALVRKLAAERRRADRELPARRDGEARPRPGRAWPRSTRASSTAPARASCPAPTSTARRSTRWCR